MFIAFLKLKTCLLVKEYYCVTDKYFWQLVNGGSVSFRFGYDVLSNGSVFVCKWVWFQLKCALPKFKDSMLWRKLIVHHFIFPTVITNSCQFLVVGIKLLKGKQLHLTRAPARPYDRLVGRNYQLKIILLLNNEYAIINQKTDY